MSNTFLCHGSHPESKGSLVFLVVSLFLLVHGLLSVVGPVDILHGELVDTDSYTRLNRVLFIHDQGHWNASVYPRSNAPYGESIHWTKPMDLILLAGGAVLSLGMPFATALHLWGVVLSPILHLIAFGGLAWLFWERADRLGKLLLLMTFLLQPFLTSYFMIGRPDHHSLLLTIFCWFLYGLHQGMQSSPRVGHFVLIGGLGALGLWVSVEFLMPIGLFLMTYTLLWIWEDKKYSRRLLKIVAVLWGVATVMLILERMGEDLLAVEYDRISLAHWSLLGLITLVWMGIVLVERYSKWPCTPYTRLGLIGFGTALASVGQWKLFPGFFKGPLAEMDPVVRRFLWENTSETQSLVQWNPLQVGDFVTGVGIAFLVVPYLVYKVHQRGNSDAVGLKFLFLTGICLCLPLALYERRWTPYVNILLIIPYVECLRTIMVWAEERCVVGARRVVPLVLGFGLLFGPQTVGTALATGSFESQRSDKKEGCSVRPFAEYLSDSPSWEKRAKTILAWKDFGPELLYRTPHRIISTPMHRNNQGLRDMLTIMKTTDPDVAHEIIKKRGIDLIMICTKSNVEEKFFDLVSWDTSFYTQLRKGRYPPWLQEIRLPENLQNEFRLFEAMQDPT